MLPSDDQSGTWIHGSSFRRQDALPVGSGLCALAYRPPLNLSLTSVVIQLRSVPMNIAIEPVLALVFGILILLVPRFLNYFVGVYLIVVGILGLIHR